MESDDILAIIFAAICVGFLLIIPLWNNTGLEKNYTIVSKVTGHDVEKDNQLKYRVECGGFDDGIVFYTDSVYKPGDTLYLRK